MGYNDSQVCKATLCDDEAAVRKVPLVQNGDLSSRVIISQHNAQIAKENNPMEKHIRSISYRTTAFEPPDHSIHRPIPSEYNENLSYKETSVDHSSLLVYRQKTSEKCDYLPGRMTPRNVHIANRENQQRKYDSEGGQRKSREYLTYHDRNGGAARIGDRHQVVPAYMKSQSAYAKQEMNNDRLHTIGRLGETVGDS